MSTGADSTAKDARDRSKGERAKGSKDTPAKTARGTREFTRRAKAAQRRQARRQTTRNRAAVSSRSAMSLMAWTRDALGRIPRAALVCALLAFVNAVCWAQITPPFQGADEGDHFAYVQELVENNRLPTPTPAGISEEEATALLGLNFIQVRFRPNGHLISTEAEQETLEQALAKPTSRSALGDAGVATSQPPLYYALEAIPYAIGSGGSILDRLDLMRLLSAVFAGLTALFVFLFLRESLPAARWAWTVGGLGVALTPILGLVSGAVNPDALLFTVSAALFYCFARAFRRGLTQRLAIAIGALIALGLMTKLNFAGLVPGAILGLIVLARREARLSGTQAYYRMLAPGLAIAVSPGVVYGLVNLASNHSTFGLVSGSAAALTGAHRSIAGELQLHLAVLPAATARHAQLLPGDLHHASDLAPQPGWAVRLVGHRLSDMGVERRDRAAGRGRRAVRPRARAQPHRVAAPHP